jgi:hypothetical protein
MQHPHAHFHRRHDFSKGFWEPLPPNTTLLADTSRATSSKRFVATTLHPSVVAPADMVNYLLGAYFPVPPVAGTRCSQCQAEEWSQDPVDYRPLKCITIHGMESCSGLIASSSFYSNYLRCAGQLSFSKAAYVCACGHKVWQGIEEFISIGFWPATVTRVRVPVSPPLTGVCCEDYYLHIAKRLLC